MTDGPDDYGCGWCGCCAYGGAREAAAMGRAIGRLLALPFQIAWAVLGLVWGALRLLWLLCRRPGDPVR